MPAQEFNTEVLVLFNRWLGKTVDVLQSQLKDKRVGVTQDLHDSIRFSLQRQGDGQFVGTIEFLLYGRFRDMGVGRGTTVRGRSVRSSSRLQVRGRKPVKWYSRPFYGRLNDLQGAIGYSLMDSSVLAVKNGLEK